MNFFLKVQKAVREGGVQLLIRRAAQKTQWSLRRRMYLQYVKHALAKKLPSVDVQLRPIQTAPDDVEIAKRILKAFAKAQQDEKKSVTGDIWDRIQAEHGDFYAIYKDPVKVAEYMNNVNQHSLTKGMSSSTLAEFQDITNSAVVRQEWGVFIKDVMVCFAEAVGALPYNLTGENLYADESAVLFAIESQIGIQIMPSDIEGGLYKLKIGERYFMYRDFWSVYLAWRVYQLVGAEDSIAEIGGGLGAVALFAGQFGIKKYAIFDLPIVNLLQAWYLIKSGVDVALYGEEKRPNTVSILPYWEFAKDTFDLTLNVDSFPEMDGSIVADYLETIKKNTRKYLVSINQEETGVYGDGRKHIVVQDIVARVGGFKRSYRFPFWFLKNYAEELYTIEK